MGCFPARDWCLAVEGLPALEGLPGLPGPRTSFRAEFDMPPRFSTCGPRHLCLDTRTGCGKGIQ